ncbi:hypothetical protein, partial [Nitrososphaera sp.]|uniref:hypothetical protein n=1 Tax=Nitrososphaera sp. TaxID=1971748 RepID=UPI002ED8309F
MQNTFVGHQLAEFGKDGISYIEASKLLKKYVENTATASEISAQTYKSKIARFLYFIFKTYEKPFDTYVEQLKKNPDSAYDLLAD